MKKIILFLITVVFLGCTRNNQARYTEGIYGLRSYFEKDNFIPDYVEYFLLKVSKDKITYYGTVNTWGNTSNRNIEDEKNNIINDSVISIMTVNGNGGFQGHEYIKLKAGEDIIDKEGINRTNLVRYLDNYLISGNYKLKDKNVIFKEGKIYNLDTLNTYSTNPRFGTNWWYDYKTIWLNNELWKFEFNPKHLILTKYKKPKIEQQVELSSTQIILLR